MPPRPARLLACLLAAPCVAGSASGQENILFLVADDVGVDAVAAYAEHPAAPPTPFLDQMAAAGVLFRNAYSQPSCSPTRAELLTGRHAARHGIHGPLKASDPFGLPASEVTLPKLLQPLGYRSYCFGKWHLAGQLDPWTHPEELGFDYFEGPWTNLNGLSYYRYVEVVNGQLQTVENYSTTEIVDDALRELSVAPEPWFGWVAFNAAHSPWEAPPVALLSGPPPSGSPQQQAPAYMRSMTEAMDAEIGRLFTGLGPELLSRTNIVFLGDNGTDPATTLTPFVPAHAKGTVYEGGSNVPLLVVGPAVGQPGGEVQRLVTARDLVPTFAELLGIDLDSVLPRGAELDGVSFLPTLQAIPGAVHPRQFVEVQTRVPNGAGPYSRDDRSILSSSGYKLVARSAPALGQLEFLFELFDLQADPFELHDLLLHDGLPPPALAPVYHELRRELQRYEAELAP